MAKHTTVECLQQAIDRLDASHAYLREALSVLTLTDLYAGPSRATIGKGLLEWRKYLEGLVTARAGATDAGSRGDA